MALRLPQWWQPVSDPSLADAVDYSVSFKYFLKIRISQFLKKVQECNNTDPGIEDEALFGGHVGRIRARVGETFAAVGALERLLTRMNPDMLLNC